MSFSCGVQLFIPDLFQQISDSDQQMKAYMLEQIKKLNKMVDEGHSGPRLTKIAELVNLMENARTSANDLLLRVMQQAVNLQLDKQNEMRELSIRLDTVLSGEGDDIMPSLPSQALARRKHQTPSWMKQLLPGHDDDAPDSNHDDGHEPPISSSFSFSSSSSSSSAATRPAPKQNVPVLSQAEAHAELMALHQRASAERERIGGRVRLKNTGRKNKNKNKQKKVVRVPRAQEKEAASDSESPSEEEAGNAALLYAQAQVGSSDDVGSDDDARTRSAKMNMLRLSSPEKKKQVSRGIDVHNNTWTPLSAPITESSRQKMSTAVELLRGLNAYKKELDANEHKQSEAQTTTSSSKKKEVPTELFFRTRKHKRRKAGLKPRKGDNSFALDEYDASIVPSEVLSTLTALVGDLF